MKSMKCTGETRLREFDDGEELRNALPGMAVGTPVLYRGVLHVVVDAGPEQGHRVACARDGAEGKP